MSAVPSNPPSDPCPKCGKDRAPGPTARFKAFVDPYAPGKHTAAERAEFYRLRSSLTHGHKLMRSDISRSTGKTMQ